VENYGREGTTDYDRCDPMIEEGAQCQFVLDLFQISRLPVRWTYVAREGKHLFISRHYRTGRTLDDLSQYCRAAYTSFTLYMSSRIIRVLV